MGTSFIPERIVWSLQRLGPIDGLSVLEIGCGTGVAIASMLRDSHPARVRGIDRSVTAIQRARSRNEADVERGRVDFIRMAFENLERQSWDRVMAINVNAFWLRPASTLPALRDLLSPAGRFLLVFEAPTSGRAGEIAGRLGHPPEVAGLRFDPAVQEGRFVAFAGRAA